ncbi:exotoxin [Staphylococcus pseudintermedius]|uniref:exotoxin OB-fold domain-containing protein n=1 Tax=Staphylococcus pseudintermedius TaxID=283734 RepID=UPI002B470AD3|nr:exotoxin OB-fold domain-containing protein [Staphylococcus pseudintermedius]
MKKLLCILLIMLSFLSMLENDAIAISQPDPKPGELNKASDYIKNKGTMGNIEVLYKNDPVQENNVKNTRQFLAHDLIFPIHYKGYKEVRSELESDKLANKYKNKKVEVFGVPYFYTCLVPENAPKDIIFDGVCMYGGLTMNETEKRESKAIVVPVSVNENVSFSFTINTDKRLVTAQELDYKVRNWLTKYKNLYEFNGSAYETGYVKFIEKNDDSFWYDMFPKKELVPFIPYKFLSIYGDNKVLESDNIKIEVHLTTR